MYNSLNAFNFFYFIIFDRHPLAENPDDWPIFLAEQPIAYELNAEHAGTLTYPRTTNCEFWRPYMSPESC